MDDVLAAEIEGIVDKQLQDCGFIDLCTRIAQKVVEKVQRIEEDHGKIKGDLSEIEEKLNGLLTDKIPTENKPLPVKKDVIIIEEEEEDSKPLVAKLHEITKSSQMLSCNTEVMSPSNQQNNNTLDTVARTVTSGLSREQSTVSSSKQKSQPSYQYGDTERNTSGSTVVLEEEKPDLISTSSEQQNQMSDDQKMLPDTAEVADAISSQDCPKSPIVVSEAIDIPRSPLAPIDTSPSSKNESNQQLGTGISSSEVESSCDEKPKTEKSKEGDCSLKPNVLSEDKKQLSTESAILPEQHKELVEDEEKEMESQEELALESYEYKEGDRVLGKPDKSDIWYTAKISKIIVNKYNQRKYQVKFESGLKIHGTLPGSSLAPIAHPKQSSLNIGSRVAAIRPRETVDARIQKKYMNLYASDFAKGEILFGGVVVERACEENNYRFLVVFDDGFAEYMTEKKMHLVINAAEDVWQEVSVHCREFIKEYLEEYPKRPMLKVKPGLSIQTEWNGKWLQAKVIAVDCSLVKMIFDVDKRTEWIYRGSTRLEPLYSELERRDLEALKSKGRKWNKKKRSTVVKKVEPYVEDAITKPCFGISRFSKTDPKGLQQIKEWGPVIEKNSPTTSQDELMPSDSDISNTELSAKIAADATASSITTPESSSRKRKLDEPSVGSEASADTINIETESGNDVTPTTKDITSVLPMTSPVTPGSSPSSKTTPVRRPLQRNSSQSSIDSTASDSQLLLRSNKDGRLRRLSNSSVRSTQSDRTDLQPRGNTQARHDICRIDLTNTPRSPGSIHKLPVSKNSPVKEKTSNERTSLVRPFQRLILPRPAVQQPVQFWIPQGSGPFPFPQVFIPKLAINQLSLAHVQFQPQITGNVITVGSLAQSFPKVKGPHDCSSSCILHVRLAPGEKQKHNPLSIPLILGWTRETAKRKPGYHRDIYYRAPCSRRLRNMSEVSKFLLRTSATNVTIDQFSFDSSVSCRDQIPVFRLPKLHIEDISYGKEKFPIPCVNEKSDELPPHVEYISNRIVGKGININTDRSFLACCDCTDNCQDKEKCACARLTIDSSDAIDGKIDEHNGYHYRRLKECVTTGIYECNQNCSCSETCYNRVVQNGIGVRLQVFMTDSKGWGLRCLDDIPRGTFICTYSGQILNEEMADKEGTDYGDEYLAELDHIEVVEKAKEGYESDVPELRSGKKTRRSRSFESSTRGFDSDSDDSDFDYSTSPASSENLSNVSPFKDIEPAVHKTKSSKGETRSHIVDDVIDLTLDSDPENDNGLEIANKGNQRTNSLEGRKLSSSSLKYMMQKLKHGRNGEKEPKCDKFSPNNDRRSIDSGLVSKENVHRTPSPKFFIEMDSSDSLLQEEDCELEEVKNTCELDATSLIAKKEKFIPGEKSEVIDKCSQVKLDQAKKLRDYGGEGLNSLSKNLNCEVKNAVEKVDKDIHKAVAKKTTRSILFQRLSNAKRTHCDNGDNFCYKCLGDLTPPFNNASQMRLTPRVVDAVLLSEMNPGKTFTSPRSSTGGHFARKALKLQITPPGQQQMSSEYQEQQQQQAQKDILAEKSTRDYFGEDQCYVIDAKSFGNIGRYLNHSCSPNLFVQNVFIDTHDLRFPFVAFFAQQNIPAMSELTWDYSYEVGSVPGKVLQCYCGAVECRGRLL